MRRAFLVSLVLLAGIAVAAAETFSQRHSSEVKNAVALWRAASRFPGAGHFMVFADVASVQRADNGGALVVFRVGPDWTLVNDKGDDIRSETRPRRELQWLWPAGAGPVPVAVGMKVDLRVTSEGKIRRVSYTYDEIRACRRDSSGGWELVLMIAAQEEIGLKGYFLRVVPQAFNPVGSEVRWTEAHGLCVGSFADGQYGGSDGEETETSQMRRVGWPIANEPGARVLVGRDGWRRWDASVFYEPRSGANLRWLAAAAPPSQWLLTDEDAVVARKIPAEQTPVLEDEE